MQIIVGCTVLNELGVNEPIAFPEKIEEMMILNSEEAGTPDEPAVPVVIPFGNPFATLEFCIVTLVTVEATDPEGVN